MNPDYAIQIKDLWVRIDRNMILEKINLNVKKKEFLGIIGPNGGGKTTLLKAILGLIPLYKGTVNIFGKSPVKGRRKIGYVPQYTVYDKDFPISVWDVVLMGRLTHRKYIPWYSKLDLAAAKHALEIVEMYGFKKRHIDKLSGGQKQRVFIARALALNPKILLLDEPTASVDKHIQKGIYDLLKKLNEDITIILVTHDIGVISSYVDEVVCLNHRMFTHDGQGLLSKEMVEAAYQCPVELIAHGMPHRVFGEHK